MSSDYQPLVLIVEDEREIASMLRTYFERDGFRTVMASDGETAITHAGMLSPDIIILDVGLPKMDGFDVLKEITNKFSTPVIMATSHAEDLDKLLALRIGADDYVVKPFNPLEIVARARAVLKRGRAAETKTLAYGQIKVDVQSHVAIVDRPDGVLKLDLTLTEFRLLSHAIRFPTLVFSRLDLLDSCLSESDAVERTVDSHISNLRRKLSKAGIEGHFAGVRGVGYRFSPN
ncbi:response regulator [Ascidiaceihabitans sp.]|uniref:response regulator n=1 Tax=Ascidiaceihabitans sp. TaxID=1872644 RepID=UPI003298B909